RHQRARDRVHRADDQRPRHRLAEGALPEEDAHGRGDLVPALLRAQRGLGPREPQDARRGPGRPLPRQRSEDLDLQRADRRLGDPPRPHRLEGAQAQGHLVLPPQHAPAGLRVLAALNRGESPGAASSITKRSYTECEKRYYEAALEILGPWGQLVTAPEEFEEIDTSSGEPGTWATAFLWSRAGTIYSGS